MKRAAVLIAALSLSACGIHYQDQPLRTLTLAHDWHDTYACVHRLAYDDTLAPNPGWGAFLMPTHGELTYSGQGNRYTRITVRPAASSSHTLVEIQALWGERMTTIIREKCQ